MYASLEYYGQDGPILVNTTIVPYLDLWLQAGRELGHTVGDPNAFQREGNVNIFTREGNCL